MILHAHHRLRRSQGGTNDPVNIMLVSPNLHDWIHRNPLQAYKLGWLVHSYEDPEDVGCTYHNLGANGWESEWPPELPPVLSSALGSSSGVHSFPPATEGATELCHRCKGKGTEPPKPEKLEKAKKRVTLGIRLPKDADEDGIEVLETLLSAARDELKAEMGWSDSVGVYYVLTAVLHDWLTSRATPEAV